jgi:alkylated DNA nucleotide flippase Atl1
MAEMTNRAWVGDALELLAKGLKPFVKTHMSRIAPQRENWLQEFARAGRRTPSLDDPSFLLEVLDRRWRRIGEQFPDGTRNSIKLLVSILREERNIWAHYDPIDVQDAAHAISSIVMLLRAVDAVEVDEAQRLLNSFNRAQSAGEVALSPAAAAAGAGLVASRRSPTPKVDQIVDCLNRERIRATYGAVGEILGRPAQSVGGVLGGRTKRASWVVNAKTGEPTGYGADEKHPDLHRTEQIIRTGKELSQLLKSSR